jgi:hypothetical protein
MPEQESLSPKRSIQENQTSVSNCNVGNAHEHPSSSGDMFDFLDNIIPEKQKCKAIPVTGCGGL